MIIDLRQLYQFTTMQVDKFRCIARHGRKDEARDFLRYVRNSRILEILKKADFSSIGTVIDVSHLEWQVRELENDCHPASQPDYRDDFTAIRGHMETLAQGMALILKQNAAKPNV
jgi:hypothetical protein